MHWAYGGRQRQRQLMLINDVYCSGPGYDPEDSNIQLRKEGRKLYKKMNTL